MNTIYVIIADNGYDGYETPHDELFYLTEKKAQTECDNLNKKTFSQPFWVLELTLASE